MNGDDACGAWCDHALDLFGVEGVCPRVDVAKDRGDLLPLQSVCRRDKRKRRNDHLAGHIQRPDGQLQGHGSVTCGDTVPCPGHFGDFLFKFLDVVTTVGQPPAIEDVVDACQQTLAIADIGPSNIQFVVERRLAAKDRQVFQFLFFLLRSDQQRAFTTHVFHAS